MPLGTVPNSFALSLGLGFGSVNVNTPLDCNGRWFSFQYVHTKHIITVFNYVVLHFYGLVLINEQT